MGGGELGSCWGWQGKLSLTSSYKTAAASKCDVQQLLHPDAGGDCDGPHWLCCEGAAPGCVGADMLAGDSWIWCCSKHMQSHAYSEPPDVGGYQLVSETRILGMHYTLAAQHIIWIIVAPCLQGILRSRCCRVA